MNRFFYAELPDKVGQVGELSYYRWDIQQEENGYSCFEVSFSGAISREKITESVMAALYGNGYEQKLVNDYNASKLGLLGPEYELPYLDFLSVRKTIKEQIHEALQ